MLFRGGALRLSGDRTFFGELRSWNLRVGLRTEKKLAGFTIV